MPISLSPGNGSSIQVSPRHMMAGTLWPGTKDQLNVNFILFWIEVLAVNMSDHLEQVYVNKCKFLC